MKPIATSNSVVHAEIPAPALSSFGNTTAYRSQPKLAVSEIRMTLPDDFGRKGVQEGSRYEQLLPGQPQPPTWLIPTNKQGSSQNQL